MLHICPRSVLARFFGWLPETRPAHVPHLRWRDRVHADFRALSISNWYTLAQGRRGWWDSCQAQAKLPTPTSPVHCNACDSSFRRISDMARHKCISTRRLPVFEQPGASRCPRCYRWFGSAGGRAVH